MGDVRFRDPYMRLQRAQDRVEELRRLEDDEVVQALGHAASQHDPLVANVLATEALNRMRRSREMMRHIAEGVVALDGEGRVLSANPAAERLLGWSASALAGRSFAELVSPRALPDEPRNEGRPLEEPLVRESVLEGQALFRRADGSDVQVAFVSAPVMEEGEALGAVVSFRDVGAHREQARRDGVVRRMVELFAATRSVDDVLRGLPRLLAPDVARACAVYLRRDEGTLKLAGVHEADPARLATLRRIEQAYPEDTLGVRWARRALELGEPIVVSRLDEAALAQLSRDERHLELLSALDLGSAVALPLKGRGRILGVLVLARGAGRAPFVQEDVALLEPLAGRVALALDNARLDDELRASHERYELVARGAGDGIWDWDVRAGHVHLSPRWLETLGYEEGDIRPTPEGYASVLHPDDREEVQRLLEDYVAGRVGEYRVEHRLRAKDGSYRWMLSRAVLLRDRDGRPVRLVGSNTDITAHKRAEASLRESREHYRALFENSPYGVLTLGLDGTIQAINDASLRASGHTREETVGAHFISFVPEEDHDRVLDLFVSVVGGEPRQVRFRIRHKDGHLLEAEAAGIPVAVDGEVVAVHGIWQDKTPELLWQEALVSSEERYRELFESVQDIVYSLDPEGRYTALNAAFTEALGWPREEWLGHPFAPLVHPDDEAAARDLFEGALAGAPRRAELNVRRRDGRYVSLDVQASPRRRGGHIVGVFGIARDVTERRRHEEDLERRVAERTGDLGEALRDLQTFTDSVSHDLRAPLRGVATLLELLQDDVGRDLPPEGREVLERAQHEAARAMRLVKDLLAFSRSGKETLHRAKVEVETLAREIAGEISREHPEWRTSWRIAKLPSAHADEGLVRILLGNLLHNAAKYSARGSEAPEVDVSAETCDGETWYVVRDNGVGFPMAEAGRLFQPFARLSTAAGVEGTGLGLATVHRIVARHGGRILTESEPGRGATFRFTLPEDGERPPGKNL